MNNETKLAKAMKIAAKWHARQLDKNGTSYVAHLMGVWNRVRKESEEIQCVALLHDIFEDTECPVGLIQDLGHDIFDAVFLLTHKKGEPYVDYITKLKLNPVARRVKMADLEDNMSAFRLKRLSPDDEKYMNQRMYEKYIPAYKELLALHSPVPKGL